MKKVKFLLSLLLFLFFQVKAENPLVSIITSVYNGEKFIEGYLEDTIKQTIFNECELILINANSPQNEEQIINKYLQKYPNIKYLKLDNDPGLFAVYNKAIKLAKADLITNGNLDDRKDTKTLEIYSKFLQENPDIDLVYSGYLITNQPNETFEKNSHKWIVEPEEFSAEKMYQYLPGPQPMWRKSIHEKYGYFDESYKCVGNWEMWLKAVANGAKFKKLPGIHTLYYANPNGISLNQDKKIADLRNIEADTIIRNYSFLWDKSKKNPVQKFTATQEKSFVIVIPSYNNKYWMQRNLDSVFLQNYKNFKIIYIDDCSTDKTGFLVEQYIKERSQEHRTTLIKNDVRAGCPLANIYKAVHMCKPDDIIVLLDGDDWFAHNNVLKILNEVYQDQNVWVTYGQFIYYPSNGPGWANPIPKNIIDKNQFRDFHWFSTHLKTFYADLFQRIKKEDLLYQNRFFPMAGDLALMFPIMEMAGHHSKFIPDLLYVYNVATDLNEEKVNHQLQMQMTINIRQLPKYKPVEKLFDINLTDPGYAKASPGCSSVLKDDKPLGLCATKNKKIYIKPWAGSLFNVNDKIYNRDDCLRSYYDTQQHLKTIGYDLIQVDSFNNLKDAHLIVAFDFPQSDVQYLEQCPIEKRILYLLEPPAVRPDNYDKKNHEMFSKVYTWNDDLVDNKKYFKFYYPVYKPIINEKIDFDAKKLCILILSNKHSGQQGEIYSERKKLIDFFEDRYEADFDFYGMLWDKNLFKNYKGYADSKVEKMKNYKFCIAYENSKTVKGYVTEKIFDCFRSGCVPIYWGTPNILEYVPENCFVNRAKFKNNQELYEFMKNMSKDEYLKYLENIKNYLEKDERAKLFNTETFIKIFKHACGIEE